MPINRPNRKQIVQPLDNAAVAPPPLMAPAIEAAVQAEMEKPAITPVLDPGEHGQVLKQAKFHEQQAESGDSFDIATFRVEVTNKDVLTIRPRRGEPAAKVKHPLIVATLTDDSSKKRIQVIIVELSADTIADADTSPTPEAAVQQSVASEQADTAVPATEATTEAKED